MQARASYSKEKERGDSQLSEDKTTFTRSHFSVNVYDEAGQSLRPSSCTDVTAACGQLGINGEKDKECWGQRLSLTSNF